MGDYSVRMQIYLSKNQHDRLKTVSSVVNKPVAGLIREAIDRYLKEPGESSLGPDDPIWDIAGQVESGQGDLSEKHDAYLYGVELHLEKVKAALNSFLSNDSQLLTLCASERSISHKFAEHLQREFTEWNVDCEYNRRGACPKTLRSNLFSEIKDDDQEAKTIFPDIIIHKRQEPINCLVIEIKKSNNLNSAAKDKKKLTDFTDLKGDYKYEVGLFIVFDVTNQKIGRRYSIIGFKNGTEDPTIKNSFEAMRYGR
ncbi:MAG: hypothetical protein HY730_00045 [Candidatus Tectomicrobia bacterium]|uniref:CopG family transcriptional regulator n=1 Tax=Tectimicrobiota bacterium TaxID=2528274 RepID=A0A933LPX4_UNCTE|nr:hypothetical protein [Candidatus Tectomicrobia bacterium]